MFVNVLLKTTLIAVFVLLASTASPVMGQRYLREICRVKGQEENTLRGVGLVVGLNGTGDPELDLTINALARSLTNSGIELPRDASGREITADLQEVKNVALVFVTAKVPPTGARQGTKVTCHISAFGNATSLKGGRLLPTALTSGPATQQPGRLPVLATAGGAIHLDQLGGSELPTTGSIFSGCQLEVDFEYRYFYDLPRRDPSNGQPMVDPRGGRPILDRYVDLVIDSAHAGFSTAAEIEDSINSQEDFKGIATATGPATVRVAVPKIYQNKEVEFIRTLMNEVNIGNSPPKSVVVINERTGTIVVGEGVYFLPAAITSNNFTVETGGPFVELDLNGSQPIAGGVQPKRLQSLVNALNSLNAPQSTIIDIIKQLKTGGLLYGDIVSEN